MWWRCEYHESEFPGVCQFSCRICCVFVCLHVGYTPSHPDCCVWSKTGKKFMSFQEQQRKGVIVASDCNFSMAVAHHAAELKIPVFVIMPSGCSSPRLRIYRDYGAMVISYGSTSCDSQNHARRLAKENGYLYLEESVSLCSSKQPFLLQTLMPSLLILPAEMKAQCTWQDWALWAWRSMNKSPKWTLWLFLQQDNTACLLALLQPSNTSTLRFLLLWVNIETSRETSDVDINVRLHLPIWYKNDTSIQHPHALLLLFSHRGTTQAGQPRRVTRPTQIHPSERLRHTKCICMRKPEKTHKCSERTCKIAARWVGHHELSPGVSVCAWLVLCGPAMDPTLVQQ